MPEDSHYYQICVVLLNMRPQEVSVNFDLMPKVEVSTFGCGHSFMGLQYVTEAGKQGVSLADGQPLKKSAQA